MIFDIHVHSALSPCSQLHLADILSQARRRGLDGVCVTDHDTMGAATSLREGLQEDGLCVVVGMEYATPQGDFLIFGPFEGLAPGLDALPLLRLVEEARGAAVAAHPFRPGRQVSREVFDSGLCRLAEAVNGRSPEAANQRAMELVRSDGLAGLGGSDAHSLDELGRVTTSVHTRVTSRADFIAALRLGRCSLASPFPGFSIPRTVDAPVSTQACCQPG